MPIQYEYARTPAGHSIYRTVSSGEVTSAEAKDYCERVLGEARGPRALVTVTPKGVVIGAAARKEFAAARPDPSDPRPMVFVVESAPMRVTLSFIFKIIGYQPTMFGTETEAIEYLDRTLPAK